MTEIIKNEGDEVGGGASPGAKNLLQGFTDFVTERGIEAVRGLLGGLKKPVSSSRLPNAKYIDLEEVEVSVNEIILWLRQDIEKNPDRFFGKYPGCEGFTPEYLLSFIDDRFVEYAKELITAMIEKRYEFAYDDAGDFRRDAATILIYEMFRSNVLRGDERRHTTESYIEHERRATLRSVKRYGQCGLTSAIGEYKHDDPEDIEFLREENMSELIDLDLYKHRLDIVDVEELRRLESKVKKYVSGMQKIKIIEAADQSALPDLFKFLRVSGGKPLTFANTEEVTFFNLLLRMIQDVRLAVGKGADKVDNLETVWVYGAPKGPIPEGDHEWNYGDPGKVVAYAKLAMATLYPIADVLQNRPLRKDLCDLSMRVLNPDLFLDFYLLQKARVERFKPYEKKVCDVVRSVGADVKFEPMGLDHYLQDLFDTVVWDVTLDDFHINELDPMQEIVVTVDSPSDIERVVAMLESKLNLSRYYTIDFMNKPSKDSASGVFIDDKGTEVQAEEGMPGEVFPSAKPVVDGSSMAEDSPFVQRGIVVIGFNKELGGQMRIRVNDAKSEARSVKGVLADSMGSKPPEAIVSMIKDLVNRKIKCEIENILDEAMMDFLRPRTRFSTPHGDTRTMTVGCTTLDAACMVHPDLLIGLNSAQASMGGTVSRRASPLAIFEPVPVVSRGDIAPVLFFKSCLAGKNKRKLKRSVLGDINVDPGWVHMCHRESTKAAIRGYLNDPFAYVKKTRSQEELDAWHFETGKRYMDQLSKTFYPYLEEMLCHIHEISLENVDVLYREVGKGAIDPFEEILKKAESGNEWILEADLDDKKDEYRKLFKFFDDLGLSKRDLESKRMVGKNPDGTIREFDRVKFSVAYPSQSSRRIQSPQIDTKRLLSTMLKLSYQFNLKFAEDIF